GGADAPLLDALRPRFLPHAVLVRAEEGAAEPALARDRPALRGKPTPYVCGRGGRPLPVAGPAGLGERPAGPSGLRPPPSAMSGRAGRRALARCSGADRSKDCLQGVGACACSCSSRRRCCCGPAAVARLAAEMARSTRAEAEAAAGAEAAAVAARAAVEPAAEARPCRAEALVGHTGGGS